MKKFAIAVSILIFAAFVYLGFSAASQMNQRLQLKLNDGTNELSLSQQNYLLFHVSNLNEESPDLISVWGLLINYADPPHLVFIALYPAASDEASNRLQTEFRIDRHNTLSNRFIKRIERQFNIETNGYILVDNFAVSLLETWITQRSVNIPQKENLSIQDLQSIISNGEIFFSSVCLQAKEQGLKPVIDKIRWTELLPAHFSTNLTFEALVLAVDTLTSAESIKNCEVFINQ